MFNLENLINMKTKRCFGFFLMCLFIFNFTSCSNDDEVFALSLLAGKWVTPVPGYDASDFYEFDVKNKICKAYISGPAVDGFLREYTFVIDGNTRQITLTDKKHQLVEKYEIISLTEQEMSWTNLLEGDEHYDKEFVKRK